MLTSRNKRLKRISLIFAFFVNLKDKSFLQNLYPDYER